MDRADLIDRACRAYAEVGRGVVVMLLEDETPRYVPVEEIKTSLSEAQVEPDLLVGVLYGTGKYDPKWQAVLLLEHEGGLTISIVGLERSETVGSVDWTAAN